MNKIILIFSIYVFNSSLFAKPIEPYRCIPTSNNGFILFNSKKFPNLDSIMYYPYLKPIKVKYVKKIAIPTDEGRPYILKQNYIEYIKGMIYAELSGDFPLGDSRQPTYKSLRPFDLVS